MFHRFIRLLILFHFAMISCVTLELLPKRGSAGGRATFLHMIQSLNNQLKHRQNTSAENDILQDQNNLIYEQNRINQLGSEETRNVPFRYEVTLDQDNDMHLFWDINPPLETITFRLVGSIRRNDFLGFGFSSYGEVTDADFFVMWTNKRGDHYFQDMHTNDEGGLELDDEQNYRLEDVHLDGDYIVVTFSRKYDTCDDKDYMIDSGTSHILYFLERGAVHDPEQVNVSSLDVGLQRAQVLKSQIPDPDFPEDTHTFTMHVDQVEIPAKETTYWCQITKLPAMDVKHHVIKFEGAISPASVGIVHHMEVFHCDVPEGTEIREFNAECHVFGAERPRGLESCRQVIGAWAMGAVPLAYPEEAGYALGGPGFSRYIMMEVHYNNPGLKKGVVDSSGIKFHVTKQLRQYDAGIMELGLEYTDKYAIPPRQPLFDLTGYCIPQCTQLGLPERGMHIFASQLHTHLTGKCVFTKHYRAGAELPEVNRDNHYSPHYQEIRKLHRPVTVLPGDALVTTCQDSTANKDEITMGGFAISDEMCVNYIHYYPKAPLEVCKSSVTTGSLYAFMAFLNTWQWEKTSQSMGILDNYKSIGWSPMNVKLLKDYYDMAPLSMQCNRSDGSRFPGVEWEGQKIPTVLYPLPDPQRPCLT